MNEDELKLKIEEQKRNITLLLRKIETLESGEIIVKKHLLGLVPGKLYLLITNGRRIVGKLIYENKGFVCYEKRAGTKYYANKSFIQLIKELEPKEQETYLESNFN